MWNMYTDFHCDCTCWYSIQQWLKFFSSCHAFQHLLLFDFFCSDIHSEIRWNLKVGLTCIFIRVNGVECFFELLLAFFAFLLWRTLFRSSHLMGWQKWYCEIIIILKVVYLLNAILSNPYSIIHINRKSNLKNP